jgi:hypothetical protein
MIWCLLINLKKSFLSLFSSWTSAQMTILIGYSLLFASLSILCYHNGFILDLREIKEVTAYFFGNGEGNNTTPTGGEFTRIPLTRGWAARFNSNTGNGEILSSLPIRKSCLSAAPVPDYTVTSNDRLSYTTYHALKCTTALLVYGVYMVVCVVRG